jgi:ribokinase
MTQVHALVVGSLVMDLSFLVPRRPEPGEVILAESFGTFRGGKGYNQAVALARLGAQVVMIGAVGSDSNGREFIAALDREAVDTSRMVVVDDEPTSVAVPLVTTDGDVGFVHYPGANRLLGSEHVVDLPACDILMLQGEIPAETSVAAARAVATRGGRVFLNPAPVHHVSNAMLATADIICPNQVEAEALLGVPIESSDPLVLARELAGDDRIAVITLGARGAAYAAVDGAGVVAPPRITALDATGAGDSFCAALALALVEGQPLREAVRFACAAGAHAATVRGAEPGLPTRAQVEQLLGPTG